MKNRSLVAKNTRKEVAKAATKGTLCKKVFLEISQNLHENICAKVSFLIKLQTGPATLLKKKLWRRCFPVNIVKFLRYLFDRTLLNDCFCIYKLDSVT